MVPGKFITLKYLLDQIVQLSESKDVAAFATSVSVTGRVLPYKVSAINSQISQSIIKNLDFRRQNKQSGGQPPWSAGTTSVDRHTNTCQITGLLKRQTGKVTSRGKPIGYQCSFPDQGKPISDLGEEKMDDGVEDSMSKKGLTSEMTFNSEMNVNSAMKHVVLTSP